MAMDSFPTFRHRIYPEYKSQHDRPSDISSQFETLYELANAFGIPIFKEKEFEADDVINSLTKAGLREGHDVVIETTDSDIMVLVSEKVVLHYRDTIVDAESVSKKFGIEPYQISDYKALVGDTSDGFPGIKGIGEVSARKILKKFGSLENVKVEELEGQSRKAFEADATRIPLWQDLSRLRNPIPEVDWERCKVGQWDTEKLTSLLTSLEFAAPMEVILNLEAWR